MSTTPAVQPPADAPHLPKNPSRHSLTTRSVLLGSGLAALVCGLVPYNDYVVVNTPVIGSYLPVLLVIAFFLIIILVNAPLHRWAPRQALGAGELGVAMAMMLASCGVASQGVMRMFLPILITPFHFGAQDATFWKTFTHMGLPDWLFPVGTIANGRTSAVALDFYSSLPPGAAVPFAAWIVPLCGWGVFLIAMLATLLALAVVIGPQWAVNERLPFPLAQLETALIEPPKPGYAFNELFRSRLFWIALGLVLIVQSLSALHRYFPTQVPEIPLRFNLTTVFSEEPWVHFSSAVKSAGVYFTFIGISYFISSRVSFSLWSIFLLTEVVTVQQKMVQRDIAADAWLDQHLGASVAWLVGMLWVGRTYWWNTLRRAFGGRVPSAAGINSSGARTAVFVSILGPLVMTGWLTAMGVKPWVAVVIVALMLLAHLVVARIVGETGLPFIRANGNPMQIFTAMPASLFTSKDIYFAGVFTVNGALASRENLLTFSLHGLRVNDNVAPDTPTRWGLLAAMAWAVVLGLVVSAASSLNCYYRYSTPLSSEARPRLNAVALEDWPKTYMTDPLNQQAAGRFPPKGHNVWVHITIGAAVTTLLQAATLRWSAWPLLPVGYLVSSSWYIQVAWFSIFLGWLCKLLIVRFGGARMYQQCRPFFFGLVFGDALAAGIWMLVSLTLALLGHDYRLVQLLPM